MSNLDLDRSESWLTREELDAARERLPILYVDAVPVRVDERGAVRRSACCCAPPTGRSTASSSPGRVLYHERVRDALIRHIEKDLGPMALPADPGQPPAVHGGRVLPDARGHPVPRPAAARGVAGLRRPGGRRLPTPAGRARPRLAHPRRGRRTLAPGGDGRRATACCCARRWLTSATRSDRPRARRPGPSGGNRPILNRTDEAQSTDRGSTMVPCRGKSPHTSSEPKAASRTTSHASMQPRTRCSCATCGSRPTATLPRWRAGPGRLGHGPAPAEGLPGRRRRLARAGRRRCAHSRRRQAEDRRGQPGRSALPRQTLTRWTAPSRCFGPARRTRPMCWRWGSSPTWGAKPPRA